MTMTTKTRSNEGFKKTSVLLDNLTKKNFEKRGFSQRKILTHWIEVVGASLGEKTNPLRISFSKKSEGGTLFLEVFGSYGPEIQMQSELIKEKVNKVYGYSAINRILIKQTSRGFFDSAVTKDIKKQDSSAGATLELAEINKIHDMELRNQLKELGSLLRDKYSKVLKKKRRNEI